MKKYILIFLLILSPQAFSATSHIHIISGAKEYGATESMNLYTVELEKQFDVRVTHTATIDKSKDLPGLKALNDADLLIIYSRRLNAEKKDLRIIKKHLESGKPLLGIRTASHGIQTYLELDKVYFGGSYDGHDKSLQTKMHVNDEQSDHPILKGLSLDGWVRNDKPYYNFSNAKDTHTLISGSANNKAHPMAWTRIKGQQRIFYTSMGLQDDFKDKNFIGLLNNAVRWVLNNNIVEKKTKELITRELWPKDSDTNAEETVLPARKDGYTRVTNITEPSFTIYQAKQSEKRAPAIIVCPGGGYKQLSIDKEGTHVAEWLNSIGITAILLKYRVPNNRTGAFQDAQRTMRLVRYNAKAWNIDPKRIGILGFSAGGHLSARMSTDYKNRGYEIVDDADHRKGKPDFSILIYPAYLIDKKTKELVNGLPVTSKISPTFIVVAEDDKSYIDSAKAYAKALKDAGASVKFKLYPEGGHGFGLGISKNKWPQLCEEWLREIDILKH